EEGGYGPDWLVLHLPPDEGISLQFDVTRPGAQARSYEQRGDYVWLVGARHPHRIMILSNRTIACRSSPRQRLRRYR
ncbi:hypothetical protein QUV86_17595, partial [Xanthomonas citri pv. citri]